MVIERTFCPKCSYDEHQQSEIEALRAEIKRKDDEIKVLTEGSLWKCVNIGCNIETFRVRRGDSSFCPCCKSGGKPITTETLKKVREGK